MSAENKSPEGILLGVASALTSVSQRVDERDDDPSSILEFNETKWMMDAYSHVVRCGMVQVFWFTTNEELSFIISVDVNVRSYWRCNGFPFSSRFSLFILAIFVCDGISLKFNQGIASNDLVWCHVEDWRLSPSGESSIYIPPKIRQHTSKSQTYG